MLTLQSFLSAKELFLFNFNNMYTYYQQTKFYSLILPGSLILVFLAGIVLFILGRFFFIKELVGIAVIAMLAVFTVFFVFAASACYQFNGATLGLEAVYPYVCFTVVWFRWFILPDGSATYISLFFDNLVVYMVILISLVSFCVFSFTYYYMEKDPFIVTFFSYLSFFAFFMFILVTSSNFFQFFLGWEGIGVCSYLLVSYWFDRLQASKAGLKAFLVNRVGDFFFLLSAIYCKLSYNSFDFLTLFSYSLGADITISFDSDKYLYQDIVQTYFFFFEPYLVDLSGFFFVLIFAISAKSSQFGLHSWLPDAMEGPTPVSALIHAATMVTAGIFLLLRLSVIICDSSFLSFMAAVLGCTTCIYGGLLACFQTDVKKLIAYSTMSQLGYMLISLACCCYAESFFHLWVHGFVKALLFLSAGIIIHKFADNQDFRVLLSSNSLSLLTTAAVIFIGSTSLIAAPYFSGFFSKDLMLEAILTRGILTLDSVVVVFVFICGSLASFLTGFYSLKLFFLLFMGSVSNPNFVSRNFTYYKFTKVRDFFFLLKFFFLKTSLFSIYPLLFLSFMSIFCGLFYYTLFVGVFPFESFSSFFTSVYYYSSIYVEDFNIYTLFVFLPLVCACCGLTVCFFLSSFERGFLRVFCLAGWARLFSFYLYIRFLQFYFFYVLDRDFFFDRGLHVLLCTCFVQVFSKIGYIFTERFFLEFCGPYLVPRLLKRFAILTNQYFGVDIGYTIRVLFLFFFFLLILIIPVSVFYIFD